MPNVCENTARCDSTVAATAGTGRADGVTGDASAAGTCEGGRARSSRVNTSSPVVTYASSLVLGIGFSQQLINPACVADYMTAH